MTISSLHYSAKLAYFVALLLSFFVKLFAGSEEAKPAIVAERAPSPPPQTIAPVSVTPAQVLEPVDTPKSSITKSVAVQQPAKIPVKIPTVKLPREQEAKPVYVEKENIEKIELEAPTGAIGDRLNSARKATERKILTLERKRPAPKRSRVTESKFFSHEELAKVEEATKQVAEIDIPQGDFENLEKRSHDDLWRKTSSNAKQSGAPPPPPGPPTGGPPPPPTGAPKIPKGGVGMGPMGVSLNQILNARGGLRKTGEELK